MYKSKINVKLGIFLLNKVPSQMIYLHSKGQKWPGLYFLSITSDRYNISI